MVLHEIDKLGLSFHYNTLIILAYVIHFQLYTLRNP